MAMSMKEQAARDSSFTTTLKEWPLHDLLTWLHTTHRTALVRIGAGLRPGVIFFDHGHLYRCEWEALRGTEALHALLALDDGTLCVMQRQLSGPQPNINLPTEAVLASLQAAARVA